MHAVPQACWPSGNSAQQHRLRCHGHFAGCIHAGNTVHWLKARRLLQGILGESYARLISGESLPNDGKFHGNEGDYEVEDYFVPLAAPSRNNVLRASAGYTVAQRRRMIEATSLSFPMRSQARSSPLLD